MTQYPNNPTPGTDFGHNPYAGGPPVAPGDAGGKNTVGLVGFIISLASIITCGVLAPIGVIVSFIGLFKRPRGFAIAGVIVGLVLSLFGLLVGFGIVAGIMGFQVAGGIMQQGMALGLADAGAREFYQQNGRLPDDAEFDQVLQGQLAQIPGFFGDNFQVDYRYEVIDADSFRLTMPGFDGVFDTSDDLSEVIHLGGSAVRPPSVYTPPPAPSAPEVDTEAAPQMDAAPAP